MEIGKGKDYDELPEHIKTMLSKIPQLSKDVGLAIPETVERLTSIHERLAKMEFMPYQDDYSYGVTIANQLIIENIALRKRIDFLMGEMINRSLEFCGFKQSFRF